MYHSIIDNPELEGDYVLSPFALKNDIKFLTENGYQTILVNDLIEYVYNNVSLPDKCVMLTFDDAYKDFITDVLPLMKKYNVNAVLSVVGDFAEQCESARFLDWNEIIKVYNSGCCEICNHSDYMHRHDDSRKGCSRNTAETIEHYKREFMNDTMSLQQKFNDYLKITPEVYTYPYGLYNDETVEFLKEMGFRASLACNDRTNYITKNPDCLFNLNRFNRPSGISTECFMKKVLSY